jgi:quercetin dioxygenase-like cupin family protein
MFARRRFAACALCAAAGLAASGARAQDPGFTSTILRRIDYPGEKHAVFQVLIDIEPNAMVPRHTHPGVETTYVLEGEAELKVKGQPDRPLRAGDAYAIPAELAHSARNGGKRTRLLAVFVVEKDKPLTSPAAA